MGLDRRNFLKILGVAGTSLAVGKTFAEKPSAKTDPVEFKGILYDSTRCLGCRSCERVCAKAHGLPEPAEVTDNKIIRKTDDTRYCVVNIYPTSKGDIPVKTQCMHCNEPACAAACLTQAMYKTKEGPVIWRGDKCMGCRYCMVSCPFDVPKFQYHNANPMIVKCDMCYDKVQRGQIPTCASMCPGDAITFGTRRELLTEAHKRIIENPKDYADFVYGEHVAGGTGEMYIAPVEPGELGLKTKLQNASYPALTKGFLYSVPSVFVLLPPLLLGIYDATKKRVKEGGKNDE
ncbi:MAG: 4Fe-4S dicluster domain-containing protein [Syntrophothermus sp.]